MACVSHEQKQPAHREPSDAVRGMLTNTHRTHASAPLRLPSEHGVFPDAVVAHPLCAILDTHWLGFDINHACARDQRTVLVTAANQQLIRPFCAQHVADEIVEHVETWSLNARRSVPVADFFYTLARETTAHISAHELTETLHTRASCSEATVRRLLRATSCFTEVYRGRWQIGADQRPREVVSGSTRPLPIK